MTKEPTEPAAPGTRELFEAVYDGEDDAVVGLLRAGVPADTTDEEGQTPLYLASLGDEVGIVRLLLAAGAAPERASGPEAGDLPLCGAAVGGHTEVVRALLAAGAQPDQPEAYGFTALRWAVTLGHAGTAEALLEYGADPNLPGSGGEQPLVLAARRGSPSTVRALLRHGARAKEAALEEARQWLVRDVERELREGLLRAFGEEAEGDESHGPYEVVTRRVEEDGGVTVTVDLLRDGRPLAGNEQQTGHAAIATLLEGELGIRTPYEELAERALRCGDPEKDDWIESVLALWGRGDEETFEAAAECCASGDPLRQAFAAEVLAQLGFESPRGEGEREGEERGAEEARNIPEAQEAGGTREAPAAPEAGPEDTEKARAAAETDRAQGTRVGPKTGEAPTTPEPGPEPAAREARRIAETAETAAPREVREAEKTRAATETDRAQGTRVGPKPGKAPATPEPEPGPAAREAETAPEAGPTGPVTEETRARPETGIGLRRPFAARAVPLLRELSRGAREPALIQAVVLALGQYGDPAALPEILRHARHPVAEVRSQVALSLFGLVPGDHAEGIDTLIALTRDSNPHVRDWATTALAEVDADTDRIREALAARICDLDADTAAEAARGLAVRQDPRAGPALARILAREATEGYARDIATDAVRHVQDERLRRRLESVSPHRP
ncbi:ankyrin repeat domain-containing protein [Streptomyces sp. NPDC052236]|uniref:ankyrin repeat domain-containing protein n=1 Tax=Streptomyces sp. NPDC052236 TaxID=3365686 RepID=UPI0037D4D431